MIELPDLGLLLKDDPELMTLPSVVYEILELIDSSESSAADIVDLVSQDAVLTAKVLQMVNSAYYGMIAQIETVSHAINVVGLKALRDIVVVTKVGEKFKDIPKNVVNVESFWMNNLVCAGMAKRLDQRQLIPRHNIFAPALLSNIGALIFLQKLPQVSKRILQIAKENNQNIYEVEESILGYTHADIGAELMRKWGLPEIFVVVAQYRNHFYQAGSYINEASIVHLSASYADNVQPFINFDGLEIEPDLSVYNYISLSGNLIKELLSEVEPETSDFMM
ncbi:MAG: HDOD domain-containing protein [Gammaproteobacteria bacterium]|nr:HDOD domain-containing protein [Gammaproteobacteria bacterium]